MKLDLDLIRKDTSSCESILHFNNAGASLMPQPVYRVMTDYLALEQSVGGYEAAAQSAALIDSFYTAFADLLNADSDEIAYVENATRAWGMAVYAIAFKPGDRVLVHETSYSANYLALLHLSKTRGIEIDFIPSTQDGLIDCEVLERMVVPQTKAVFLTHAPSHDGLINPAQKVGEIARKYNLIYVLDACQSVGQMAIDVKLIGCDILCGTGRKFLRGPRGTGFLFVSRRILNDLHPPFIDLQAADWVSKHEYALRPNAKRFEGWERFMAGQIALGEAARYLVDLGPNQVEARIGLLSTELRERLSTIDGVALSDQGNKKSGIVTFDVDNIDAPDVVARLRAQNINASAVRVEHTRLGLEGRGIMTLVRASVHYYNLVNEVERFCQAIQRLSER